MSSYQERLKPLIKKHVVKRFKNVDIPEDLYQFCTILLVNNKTLPRNVKTRSGNDDDVSVYCMAIGCENLSVPGQSACGTCLAGQLCLAMIATAIRGGSVDEWFKVIPPWKGEAIFAALGTIMIASVVVFDRAFRIAADSFVSAGLIGYDRVVRHTAEEVPSCRVCFDDNDQYHMIRSPCDCTGTLKYIHHGCLHDLIRNGHVVCVCQVRLASYPSKRCGHCNSFV